MKKFRNIIFICLALCFVISVFNISKELVSSKKDEVVYEKILATMETSVEEVQSEKIEIPDAKETETQEVTMIEKYKILHEQNQDMVGWIEIKGTRLSYPVVQKVDEKEYYLHRNFYDDYSSGGTPFASEGSTIVPSSDNIVIYGHNMQNGTMFKDLLKYENKEFWEENKIVYFDTLYEEREYSVMYAFYEDVTVDSGHFEFYKFHNANDEEEYNEFVEKCHVRSLYETEATAEYGDELLTLVTCSYGTVNGRFVVVCKRIN